MAEEYLQVPALQGYTVRPPKIDDAEITAEMFNVCEMEVRGKQPYAAADVIRSWESPKFDKDTSVRLVLTPEGQLAAYAEVSGHQEPYVNIGVGIMVHPDYRGKGIGMTLMRWGEARANEILPLAPEEAQVAMTAACNQKDTYRVGLYQRSGMEVFRHFFEMEIEFDTPPQPPEIPEGIEIRPYDEATEIEKLSQSYLDSFQDHFGFTERTVEDTATYVRHLIKNDPHYNSALWFAAYEGQDMVGLSLCAGKMTEDPLEGHVNVLGVVRGWRKRGLGMALLRHSFIELHKQGSQRVSLSVDASSLTGATRLYEKAGMSVTERIDVYQKILRDGEVLTRQ